MLARWRLAKAATKLHTVLLDVNELTERADNAIKFLRLDEPLPGSSPVRVPRSF